MAASLPLTLDSIVAEAEAWQVSPPELVLEKQRFETKPTS
jgi:hypothetical protein